MMGRFGAKPYAFAYSLLFFFPLWGNAQTISATLNGTVMDPTGSVVPNAQIVLTAVETRASYTATSNDAGLYSFTNLTPGVYELKVTASGFREYQRSGILLAMNQVARLDVQMELGATLETVQVVGNVSPINYDTPELKGGISPDTLQELPLLLAGTVRSSASFAVLMPGVTTGAGNNPFDSRINGGLQTGDEAVLDGVSMQQGMMNQSGMISILTDFPMTPDMVSELSVLTSTYDASYGSSTSGQIVLETKSGTDEYHGSLFEFHRNAALNARPFGSPERPPDIEHDFGGNLGGPFKLPNGKGIPLFWSGKKRSYFYVNLEGFRNSGGVNRPVLSVPTAANKRGDFSDWRDEQGNLIPIYDPATLRPNPNFNPGMAVGPNNLPFLKDQFMGCDPVNDPQPNVICPDRIQNSLALQWLRFLPDPTRPGPLNNFDGQPVPDVLLARTNYLLVRGDQYYGDKDHFAVTVWYQGAKPNFNTALPNKEVAFETVTEPQFSFVDRIRWTRTIKENMVNQFAFGYLNRNEGIGAINASLFPDALPRILGVPSQECPPTVQFSDDFTQLGANNCFPRRNETDRPAYVFLDTLTWVRGRHTFKFGGEWRDLGQSIRNVVNTGGTFGFGRGATGLVGINSGHPIASFLLEAVDNASVRVNTINSWYPRSDFYVLHFNDTWRATSKLSLSLGLRWDTMTPAVEKFNHFSFFDPLGANPGAAGRPGRLAFAGTGDLQTDQPWPAASAFGRRHPEKTWWKGFAPRAGIAYTLSPNSVIRAGYGIFFTQAFYPGWESSISTEGFNGSFGVSSTQAGLQPAFFLSQGFPIGRFQQPPFIDPAFRNGQDIFYRPFEANARGYAQQWNLTVEHQLTNDLVVSAAYVGNKGTRLPSRVAPLNALDPRLLNQFGPSLFDEFGAGDLEKNGIPVPYAGWVEQLQCAPSVAQALLPFPQFCSQLQGLNENAGTSIYHSGQFKVEKRFSQGMFLLASYTIQKGLTTATDHTQADALLWSGAHGVISPFERERNKALFVDDVPQTFSLAFVQELPFGRGKRWAAAGGPLNVLGGGWTFSTVFRATSGIPFFFRSSNCGVPAQFRVGCIPAILSGADPFAQSKGDFDPNQPLFNRGAFEPVSAFDDITFFGQGPRISNVRGFGFQNQDISLAKETQITERVKFTLRFEFFNVWNWHKFTTSGAFGDSAFDIDIASPTFGLWNGAVTNPRNIQVGGRISF